MTKNKEFYSFANYFQSNPIIAKFGIHSIVSNESKNLNINLQFSRSLMSQLMMFALDSSLDLFVRESEENENEAKVLRIIPNR